MALVTFTVVASVGLQGCGPGKKAEAAAEACEEFREVLIARALECADELGESYTEEDLEREFSSTLDCDEAHSLRDEDEFYDECLPSIEMLDCTDLLAGVVSESCEDQIQF